jgi:hypothetical protein
MTTAPIVTIHITGHQYDGRFFLRREDLTYKPLRAMSRLLVLTADFHRKIRLLDLTRFGIGRLLFLSAYATRGEEPNGQSPHSRCVFIPRCRIRSQLTHDYCVSTHMG